MRSSLTPKVWTQQIQSEVRLTSSHLEKLILCEQQKRKTGKIFSGGEQSLSKSSVSSTISISESLFLTVIFLAAASCHSITSRITLAGRIPSAWPPLPPAERAACCLHMCASSQQHSLLPTTASSRSCYQVWSVKNRRGPQRNSDNSAVL